MTSGILLRQTAVGCAVLGVAVVVGASLAGHPGAGLGVGAGLLLGSLNGYLIDGLLGRGAPFVAGSLLRLVFFSSLVLLAAFVLRGNAWTVALGIAVAQLVLVAFSIRTGLQR
ncbi:MAG TPA: hypothetical protein VJQ08_10965 [Candidatus Dormibacteraeota bacterium]|nr:hypothetical protein [Candidatus Dormibacteraeota bacterium]